MWSGGSYTINVSTKHLKWGHIQCCMGQLEDCIYMYCWLYTLAMFDIKIFPAFVVASDISIWYINCMIFFFQTNHALSHWIFTECSSATQTVRDFLGIRRWHEVWSTKSPTSYGGPAWNLRMAKSGSSGIGVFKHTFSFGFNYRLHLLLKQFAAFYKMLQNVSQTDFSCGQFCHYY